MEKGSDTHLASIYQPLYEISSRYLEDGYSVYYVVESVPDQTAKEKVTGGFDIMGVVYSKIIMIYSTY